MNCLVMPCYVMMRRRRDGSRLGYRPLEKELSGYDDGEKLSESQVMVVVGKEKRVFLVESFVLEENPFRVLMETMKKKEMHMVGEKRVIFVDVDAILFEHMLWLMYNDCSSLFNLNLKEIIDFYAQDY